MNTINQQIVARMPNGQVLVKRPQNQDQPSSSEQAQLQKLQQRDRQVRAHEMSHVRQAQGNLVSNPQYDYTTGPDGKRYAIGGKVQIAMGPSSSGNLQDTIRNARQVRLAALSASNPSAQDINVAFEASRMEQKAQRLNNQSDVRMAAKAYQLNSLAENNPILQNSNRFSAQQTNEASFSNHIYA